MRLSNFSDYSLRVLMYLGQLPERLATIAEIAAAHGISEAHLMKVVHHLGREGYLETQRGKGGGIRLRLRPSEIVVGAVIRSTENSQELVDCAGGATPCCLHADCRLRSVLDEAVKALFLVFDSYTLADLLQGQALPTPATP